MTKPKTELRGMSPATGLTIIIALIATIATISVIYMIIGPPTSTTTTLTVTQTVSGTATTITVTETRETTKTELPPASPTTPITDTTTKPPSDTTTTKPPPPPSGCATLNIEDVSYEGPVAVVRVRLIKDGCDGRLSASVSDAVLVGPSGGYYDIPAGPVNNVYEFKLVDDNGNGIGAINVVYTSPRTANPGSACLPCQVQNGTRIKFPICKPEFALKDTNATHLGGDRYMVLPGQRYYLTVAVDGNIPASPAYPYRLFLSIDGPGASYIAVAPPNPQFLTSPVPPTAYFTYYIDVASGAPPTTFVPVIEGWFDVYNITACRAAAKLAEFEIGKPQPRQCSVWVDAPRSALVWVTGGPGSLLATIDVLVRSVPSGLTASLSASAPPPLSVLGVTPPSGTTDFPAQVMVAIPMTTPPGRYDVVYSAQISGQDYQCATRNITSIEVRRCFWNIRILNSTPLVLEVGRTYKLAVQVQGGPYPAVLTAAASGVFTVSPASMAITSDGTYYFDLSATSAGSGAVTVAVRSADAIYEMCRNRTAAEGVAKEQVVCRPTIQIVRTNATDLGGGRYMVMPGGLYRFEVQVGGSLPSASYLLRLLPHPDFTIVNPASGQYSFIVPPMPSPFQFDIQISSAATPGSSIPLLFQLSGQGQGAVICAANMSAVMEVGKPRCPRIQYDTNATAINGTYVMEPGKTYRFTVFLSAPWAYQPIYVTLQAPNAYVSAGPYSTSPSVPVTPTSGTGSASFAVSPPSPAQPLSGQFTFYVSPSAGTDRVSIVVIMGGSPTAPPTCLINETRPVKPLICKPEVALVGGNATIVGPNTILVDPGAPYEIKIQIGGVINYPWARWRWLGNPSLTINPMIQMIPTPIPPPQTLSFTVTASGPGIFSAVGVIEVSPVLRPRENDIKTCYKYQLWVNASQWDFLVKAEPVNATAKPGSTVDFKLHIATLSGTPRTVYLSVHSRPSGWSVNISPSSGVPPYSATVSVTVPSTARGTYPVEIKATSGSVTKYITLYIYVP